MALHTGAKPLFFDGNHCLEHLSPYPEQRSLLSELYSDVDDLDEDIAKIWEVMRSFCSLINLGAEAQGRIPWELFLSTMTSVMYRLLYVSFDACSANEAIRLGLLSFCSHVFLQARLDNLAFVHLSNSYKKCLNCVEFRSGISPRLFSWLLIIGAISVFDKSDNHWLKFRLRANIESCGVKYWSEMQLILESLMWIPIVQENLGKDVFDSASELE